MKALIAYEFSQVVCKAFREKGHEAYSCDILPTEGNPEWHIQEHILTVLKSRFAKSLDFLGIHDPCTYQANSGVQWLYKRDDYGARIIDAERWESLFKSCEFTKLLLNFPVPMKYRENPIPHKYALELIGRKYDQIIQPKDFGDPESKATCLWLFNLPPLMATLIHSEFKQSVFKTPPSPDRWKIRSRTFQGIANAMAEQWG